MKIIQLNQNQYKNYSKFHKSGNFGQTVEYSLIKCNNNKLKLFLGLIDDENNIHAATLLLVSKINNIVNEAIAPNGYLIDYSNFELVNTFTNLLCDYLKKIKITYLITNPMYKHRIYNKFNVLVEDNMNILNNLLSNNYHDIGYINDFERYDIVIDNDEGYHNIYNNFNRNTKRNIQEGINYGITLCKGKISDIDKAYQIFKKKSPYDLEYYENLMNTYKFNDNKMEIFFAKLNPHTYLVNSKKLYEEESYRNDIIHNTFNNSIGHITEKMLNKKINSDRRLDKYKNNLSNAIYINNKYTEDIIIGTSIIIKNNHEIYFLIDGYKEEFRHIHSTHILKWAIIKKYSNLGYKIFNLGEVYKDYINNNKFHGQYMYKIGFGGNIVEYPPNLLLIVNKQVYNTYIKLKKLKIIKK